MVGVVLFRTFTFKSKQIQTATQPFLQVSDEAVKRLQQAVQFKTISYDDASKIDSTAFLAFHDYLKTSFPLVFAKLKVEKVNNLSLLLHWKGENETQQPIVLMAHQDVVPVEEATRKEWSAEPFSGDIINGYIYGRGTIDDKGSLMAILESVEVLLEENYVPKRDIYFAFGHDEEVTGKNGAEAIVKLFKERNIVPEMVLDEGGMITETKVPGLHRTAAVVGIAEKGYMTVDLKINVQGGHSSMPEKNTAIDQLAEALVKLKNSPFPAELGDVVHSFMDYVGPELPFVNKMAMANRWLFSPLIKNIYSKSPAGNATIRTTSAFTVFNAGVKENVIPGDAQATINLRTLPTAKEQEIIDYIKKTIDNDRIIITIRPNKTSPQQIADINHPTFRYLQQTISAFEKDIVVAPFLMIGATDGRYFGDLTTQVLRFIPFTDIEGLHGVNERIGVEEYKKGISFYYYFIKGGY